MAVLYVLSGVPLVAQVPFQRTLGLPQHESVYSVLPKGDGYMIAGVTNSNGAGSNDILILKTDLNYNPVWAKTYGGSQNDLPHLIIGTSDGGYLIIGSTNSFGQGEKDIILIKLAADFSLEWTKTYGRDYLENGFCGLEVADGFVIGGTTKSGNGALIIKTDFAGDVVWSKTYGFDATSTECFNILLTDGGNFIFDGPYEYAGEIRNYMLIEITPSGNLVMARTYNAPEDDKTSDILKIPGDGYYILGNSDSYTANGSFDLLLMKTDLNGNIQWTKNYGSSEDLWASEIILSSNNELIITCHSDLFDKLNNDIIVLKCDLSGNLQWAKSYGGGGLENQHFGNHGTVYEVHDNLYTLIGQTSSFGQGLEDLYIIGFDKQGESACNTHEYYSNISVTSPAVTDEDIALPVTDFIPMVTEPNLSISDFTLIDTLLCPLQQPPLALFEASDTAICFGICIDFIDQSIDDPEQWRWYFEGAIPDNSLEQFPTGICYPDTGCFDVQLIVSNTGGQDTLLLENYICVSSVPGFSLGNDTALCFTDTIILHAPPGYPNYLWNTGATIDSIEVYDPGEYWVRVENDIGCFEADTINVDFNSFIIIDLGPDSIICPGDSVVLNPGSGYTSYLWQDGSSNQTFKAINTGYYWVEVMDDLGCEGADTVYVEVALNPVFSIGPDTLICEGATVLLDAGAGYASYLWQDSSLQQQFTAYSSGIYWVEVTNNAGCPGSDTAEVEVFEIPDIFIGNDTTICGEFSILLDAGNEFDNYLWQDGSRNNSYDARTPGGYWVVAEKYGCENSDSLIIEEECPSHIRFPNSFTPNGDGKNETFKAVYDNVNQYQIRIYSRWGQLVFESTDISTGWDGTFNNSLSPTGVYVFIAEYTDNLNGEVHTIKGSVTLIK